MWRLWREQRLQACAGAREGLATLIAQKRIEFDQQARTNGVQANRCGTHGVERFLPRLKTRQPSFILLTLADGNPQGWRYVLLQQPGVEPGSDEARVSAEHVLEWLRRHV